MSEEFIEKIRADNKENMETGIKWGWWPSLNEKGEPNPWPIIVDLTERTIFKQVATKAMREKFALGLPENMKFMSQLLSHLEIFSSVSEARKAGWNKEIVPGEYWFNKKTKHVIIK